MAIAGPGGVDAAIASGIDLDGSPIPQEMLSLYTKVMDLESQRARSGVKKSMRNRVVKTGSKHFDQETLDARLKAAGWEGLKAKEVAFFTAAESAADVFHGVDHLLLERFQIRGVRQSTLHRPHSEPIPGSGMRLLRWPRIQWQSSPLSLKASQRARKLRLR